MSDDEISDELGKLNAEWDALRKELQDCGGHSGSPGEWIVERMDELKTERVRRLISLDGDIGRHKDRTR